MAVAINLYIPWQGTVDSKLQHATNVIEIKLGIHFLQLNIGCLCKSHAGAWSVLFPATHNTHHCWL
jgi:hypothetical protein